ncbi:MAG: hypothetical protein GWP10_18695 [Nitrospiraceae bacterium]|nr:hypothetical protein [Nitrospiraceae bacterium]
MENKSLLDLETARRRLERLDAEQQELSDLIKKLKQIRDVMTDLQSETEQQKLETEKWLVNIEKTAKDTASKATETNKAFSDSLQSFEQRANSLLEKLDGEASQLRGELETQFEQFRDAQVESLDQVSRSYERMRVAYDTIRDTTSSLETSVEDILKRLQRIQENKKKFEDSINADIEQKYNELKEVKSGMEIIKQKNTNIEQQFDGLQRALGEHTDAMTAIIEELRTELDHKESAYIRKFRSIWIAIICALLLGGIAVAMLVIQYFTM